MAGKVQVARRERLLRLCKSIVADPSSVDDGTVDALGAAAIKYAKAEYPDLTGTGMLHALHGSEVGRLVRKAVEVVERRQLERSPATGALYVADEDDNHLLDDEDDDRERDDDDEEKDDLMTDNINKAHRNRGGPHNLTGALLEHLHDRLERRREQHGYQKSAKDSPMDTVHSIMKDCGGPVAFAKTICDTGRSYGVSEQGYVESAGRWASELYGLPSDRAFAKLCESDGSVMRACGVLKAAEFSAFDIKPVVIAGPDAMLEANDDDSAVLRATKEIQRIGREKFPFLSADQQFARIFEDKNYEGLARQAHSRPRPTTIYRPPASQGTAYTKSADPAPNTDTAYAELMAKAEQLRSERPELSVAQCFDRIYTNRGNVELAKRERMESAPR